MNIHHGLENIPYAFSATVSGAICIALMLHAGIMRAVGSSNLKKLEQKHFAERQRLNALFQDMPAVDMATKSAFFLARGDQDADPLLNHSEFKILLRKAAEHGSEKHQRVVNAIFSVFGSEQKKGDEGDNGYPSGTSSSDSSHLWNGDDRNNDRRFEDIEFKERYEKGR
jgi:hypothetical protein